MKLSIIIPTLNEVDYLPDTILKAREHAFCENTHEFIVVDSGSRDETREIARSLGAIIVTCEDNVPGKAHLLNMGAASAAGDVYLFLDADTILPPAYDILIERTLNDPASVGGAFEFSLCGCEFGLRVVELINRVRFRIRQRYYGDQGIFVRAGVFNRVGGYPDMRLLESAHLCKILRSQGKLKLVNRGIKTSPRRFITGGIYRVLASDIMIWFLDLLGFSVEKYADPYWEENMLRVKS
jgi:rSAM/selenodomain-associated transferase 2